MIGAIGRVLLGEARKRLIGYAFKGVELAAMWSAGHWWGGHG